MSVKFKFLAICLFLLQQQCFIDLSTSGTKGRVSRPRGPDSSTSGQLYVVDDLWRGTMVQSSTGFTMPMDLGLFESDAGADASAHSQNKSIFVELGIGSGHFLAGSADMYFVSNTTQDQEHFDIVIYPKLRDPISPGGVKETDYKNEYQGFIANIRGEQFDKITIFLTRTGNNMAGKVSGYLNAVPTKLADIEAHFVSAYTPATYVNYSTMQTPYYRYEFVSGSAVSQNITLR